MASGLAFSVTKSAPERRCARSQCQGESKCHSKLCDWSNDVQSECKARMAQCGRKMASALLADLPEMVEPTIAMCYYLALW